MALVTLGHGIPAAANHCNTAEEEEEGLERNQDILKLKASEAGLDLDVEGNLVNDDNEPCGDSNAQPDPQPVGDDAQADDNGNVAENRIHAEDTSNEDAGTNSDSKDNNGSLDGQMTDHTAPSNQPLSANNSLTEICSNSDTCKIVIDPTDATKLDDVQLIIDHEHKGEPKLLLEPVPLPHYIKRSPLVSQVSRCSSRQNSSRGTSRQVSFGDVSSIGGADDLEDEVAEFHIPPYARGLVNAQATAADRGEFGRKGDLNLPSLPSQDGKLLNASVAEESKPANGDLSNLSTLDSKDDSRDRVSLSSIRRSTSKSSLASTFGTIKDRIILSLPDEVRKKPEETRLRLFVFLLFAMCLGLVVASHVLYKQHKSQVRLFPNLRLEEGERKMLIYNNQNNLVLQADLGLGLPSNVHPYHCLPDNNTQDARTRCLEWKDMARLTIESADVGELTCHRLSWQALSEAITPLDCWPVGDEYGHWYGGGESLNSRWPLDNGHINMSAFVTGDEDQTEWGNVIKKYFLNSRGLSISVEDTTPLSVSLNGGDLPGLCLKAHFNDFPYYYHRLELPRLQYTVCTDGTLVDLYSVQQGKSFWDGHKDSDLKELEKLLETPLWQVPEGTSEGTLTAGHVQSYLNTMLGRTGGKYRGVNRGYLLLDHRWQDNMGDLELTENLRELETLVSSAGMTLVLSINPFISTDSENFKVGVKQGLFVMERNPDNPMNVPALTWFKDVPAAAMLDVTNEDTVYWLKNKLRDLHRGLNNTVFFINTGNTFHTPHYFKFKLKLYNPDLYKEHFVRTCMDEIPVIGVSGASSKRPKAPAFVHLTTLNSSWQAIRTIIPNMLNLGVIGYPFLNPGPVGGRLDNSTDLPEAELFIRWWQLATFLPQLHFTTPPSRYRSTDSNILAIARSLKDIRENIVVPKLLKFGQEAMEASTPLIRPLWMLNPEDPILQRIDDQFMVGSDLLVAPILEQGARHRDVYLPTTSSGTKFWKRGTDGTFFEAGQWLNSTLVELDTVLFFIRQADNVRPGP